MKDVIDFVITWVDGNDPEWLEEKKIYSGNGRQEGSQINRFRDWEILKYWFRSVETNTPWVNKIYFITYGHLPEWIDTNNDKLVIVNHKDYIPNEYLPTFDSNVIEIFMNRIEGLSEKFVYFNDDTIIINKMNKDDFFLNGYPKDSFIFNAVSAKPKNNLVEHTVINNLEIISKYFNKKNVVKQNFKKIYSLKYGTEVIKTILLTPWKYFTGIENQHMPMPYLKSTFNKLWELEGQEFCAMASSKFRDRNDYSIWLMRYWQLCSGRFEPKSYSKDKYYDLSNNNDYFLDKLLKSEYNMVCINDSDINLDFDNVKNDLISCFEKKFPIKSSFEK